MRVLAAVLACLAVPSVIAQCPSYVSSVPSTCESGEYSTCSDTQVLSTSLSVGTCVDCSDPTLKVAGYYCKDGVWDLCPGGYYCPLNTTSGAYDQKIKCPDDTICFSGFIEPLDCREGQDCNGSAIISESWGTLIAMGWVIILLCCLCCCVRCYNQAELAKSEKSRESYVMQEGEVLGEVP